MGNLFSEVCKHDTNFFKGCRLIVLVNTVIHACHKGIPNEFYRCNRYIQTIKFIHNNYIYLHFKVKYFNNNNNIH